MRRWHHLGRLVALLSGLLACCVAAQAQSASADDALQAQYRQEVQACAQLGPQQDQDACRKDARNALAEARRGQLDNPVDAATYRRNAEARCNAFTGQDRADCIDRLDAPTHTDGSVSEGGLLRERRTIDLPR